MIEVKHISKAFGEKILFQNLSFTLPDRGVVALTGKNGSGKTTLLRMLAGVDLPDDGEILLPEQCRVSFVFQDYRLLPALTVKKNLQLVLPKERRREADRYLQAVGLEANANTLPRDLSGGMQQRAAIARAFACEHDLLLMDEPFAALDDTWHSRMLEAVLEEGSRTCVLLTTHDAEDLAYLGCRQIQL